MNDGKMEFLIKKMPNITTIHIGDTAVEAVKCARNIGAELGTELIPKNARFLWLTW